MKLHFHLHFTFFSLETWSKLNETLVGAALHIPIGTAKNRFKKHECLGGKNAQSGRKPRVFVFVCEDVGSFDVLYVFSSKQKDFSPTKIDWTLYHFMDGIFLEGCAVDFLGFPFLFSASELFMSGDVCG